MDEKMSDSGNSEAFSLPLKVGCNSMMGWETKNLELSYCYAKLISDIIPSH